MVNSQTDQIVIRQGSSSHCPDYPNFETLEEIREWLPKVLHYVTTESGCCNKTANKRQVALTLPLDGIPIDDLLDDISYLFPGFFHFLSFAIQLIILFMNFLTVYMSKFVSSKKHIHVLQYVVTSVLERGWRLIYSPCPPPPPSYKK